MPRSTIRVTGSLIEWVRPDQSVEFAFDTTDVHPALTEAIFAYGAKQILADGGAVGRDVPDDERVARMEKRARALRDGTWGFRDGHGTPKAEPDSALMFAALVAVGIVPNTPEARDIWKGLKPAERRATFAAAGPEAQAEYERRKPTESSTIGASLLEKMRAAA